MTTRIPARFRGFAFLLVLASLYFVAVGAQRAIHSNSNRVSDWLPEHFEETQRLREFKHHFGAQEFLMASWPGCGLDDERQERLAAELRKPSPAAGDGVFFAKVMTGRELVEQLMAPPLELSVTQAVQRLRGLLLSQDGRTSSVVMSVANPDHVNRHQAVAFVRQCADRVPGLSASAIHLAGTTLDGVAIDEASQAFLVLLTVASYVACVILMYFVFRCWTTTVMIFLVAFFNQQLTFAAVYYSGWHMDSVLLLAPSLIFVVTVSGGVHLANYYRDAVREQGLDGAPLLALRWGWVPCLLSAATTSLGIVSLMASHLVPIQKFGVYAAVMVMVGTGVLFVLLPCLLEQWPCRKWAAGLSATQDETSQADRLWTALSGHVTRACVPILLLAVVGTIAGCWGVTKTRCTARIHDMFEPGARIVRDYNWLEANIAPLVPIEVIVKLPQPPTEAKSYETPMIDRLQLVKQVERAVRGVEGVEAVSSALTFSPILPQSQLGGVRAIQRARLKATDRQIAEHLPDLAAARYVSIVDGDGQIAKTAEHSPGGEHWWRVSARVAASQGQDYQRVLRDLEREVTATLQAAASQFPGATAAFSGGIPLVEKAQQQMLRDLINSFISAFLVIAAALVLMMLGWSFSELLAARSAAERLGIVVRCLGSGLLAMLPNVFPCVAIFGVMGLLGIKVEVGTVMTATVAMGIAVDDTVHYITWFRRGHAQGLSQGDAVRYAYRFCGTAMVQTSLIVGLGLLVYGLSQFGPIQRFAWMMFSILLVALASDLTITPAMLHSRWGRLFLPGVACRQRPAAVLAVEPNKGVSQSDRRDIRVRPSATYAE